MQPESPVPSWTGVNGGGPRAPDHRDFAATNSCARPAGHSRTHCHPNEQHNDDDDYYYYYYSYCFCYC